MSGNSDTDTDAVDSMVESELPFGRLDAGPSRAEGDKGRLIVVLASSSSPIRSI